MSVINDFTAKNVTCSDKMVYLLDEWNMRQMFEYHIKCKAANTLLRTNFFFNMEKHIVLTVITAVLRESYRCSTMKFWLEQDRPVFSAHWVILTDDMTAMIAEDFKSQYASYLIDKKINE